MGGADSLDPAGALEDLGRRVGVEELRVARRAPLARMPELNGPAATIAMPRAAQSGSSVSSGLVEQGVAPRQHEQVEVALLGEARQNVGVVHADADRLDRRRSARNSASAG